LPAPPRSRGSLLEMYHSSAARCPSRLSFGTFAAQLPVGSGDRADSARLHRDVVLLSDSFGPRDHDHLENLDRVAASLRAEFAAAGASVSDQSWQVDGRA